MSTGELCLEIVTYKSDPSVSDTGAAQLGSNSANSGVHGTSVMDLTNTPEPKLASEGVKTTKRRRTKSA